MIDFTASASNAGAGAATNASAAWAGAGAGTGADVFTPSVIRPSEQSAAQPTAQPAAQIAALPTALPAALDALTPFDSLPPEVVRRRASKALLMQLSTELEEQAARLGQACILTSAFQHARHFTTATASRYEQVAEHAGFVYALGEAFAGVDVPGVHAGALSSQDPLCREWDVAVIGPHFQAALLARELGSDLNGDLGGKSSDRERMFEYVVTYRYDTVVTAVRDLLLRVSEHLPDSP